MVKRCAWGTCNSDDRYNNKPHMVGVTFWPIPKPKTRLQETREWVKACGRKDFTVDNVDKHAYVCSKHFVGNGPTKEFPYPLSATDQNPQKGVKRGRIPPVRRLFSKENRPPARKVQDITLADCDVPKPELFIEVTTEPDIVEIKDADNYVPEKNYVVSDSDHIYAKSKAGKVETRTMGTQTNIVFDDLKHYTDECIKDVNVMKKRLVMEDIFKNDQSCKFYTGLSLVIFSWLFSVLKVKASHMVYWNSADTNERESSEKQKPGPRRGLSLKEELAITLLRLRRNFDTKSLGNMFGISDSSISRIFNTWIKLMSNDLTFLVKWPTMEQIRNNLPKSLKYFPKTRCIIDCTEFFVQRPTLPSAQRITYSSYKHHNTFKSLLGITPTGTFSFVSDVFTGSISDKKIVQDSGFLDKIEFGDDIMADRGFLIRGDLALRGATLNIPPFSFGKQMSSNATTKTRRIARARIHVERAIGRLKNFVILQGTISLRLKPIFNDIVKVCAILCNLDEKLVKK